MASNASINNLQSLIYSNVGGSNPKLSVLDQLLVPDEKTYILIPDLEAAWGVIRSMQIRGAPLIAIVACLGLSVDLATNPDTISKLDVLTERDDVLDFVLKKIEYLKTSRPTAVNLFNAMDELTAAIQNAGDTKDDIVKTVISHAEFMLQRDVSDNKAIGNNGANDILQNLPADRASKSVRLVTICNTGSLATAAYGTALGVARSLHAMNKLESIHCLETRPYNQGSRLTAFEIMEEKMPNGTLICDSAAAALMRTKGVDACVVGADRVCANGDTANKIGTYMLALCAYQHNVPFYVAAPFTTLDLKLENGDCIEIEERPAAEMITSSRAPNGMPVWNPAFDNTPNKFITGIITEKGVIRKGEDGKFDIAGFINAHQ
jgi:S-methyl-5-thioribose-1-phosphate isomerase